MKKFIFLFALALGFTLPNFLNAEVSKDPQKRKVVIEEFTGTNCTWCPRGHKLMKDFAKLNPGNVFIINIHEGPFAGTSPNFTTEDGDAIGKKSGTATSGYPCGSTSRNSIPWVGDYTKIAAKGTEILKEDSPVNMEAKASIDLVTRKVTVDVEYFYTADSPADKNYITVVLNQNNFIAPQTGADKNPEDQVGNSYRHGHMFRMMLNQTKPLGDVIAVTKKGTQKTLKFEAVLPAHIKGVPFLMDNLEVVAFITESDTQGKIYTGSKSDVAFDAEKVVDLAVKNMTVVPADQGYNIKKITPKAEVTNLTDKTITGFEIAARVGNDIYTKAFVGSLAKDEKTEIVFDEIDIKGGSLVQLIVGSFTKINDGKLADTNPFNDVEGTSFIAMKGKAFKEKKVDFEGALVDFVFDNTKNTSSMIAKGTGPIGANNSLNAAVFFLESGRGNGKPGYLIMGGCELNAVPNAMFMFQYAYSPDPFGGSVPVVKVEVSEDFGKTWKTSSEKIEIEKTGSVSGSVRYIPKSSEYKLVKVNLAEFASQENAMIRLTVIPGNNGNALWLDDLEVKTVEPKIVSIDDDFIMFEDKKAGEQVDKQSITVNSTGTEAIKIVGMEITGADKDQFKVVSKTFPLTVKAGDSEDLMLKFEPTKEGKFTAKAIIKTDVKDLEITLKGTGLSSSVDQAVVEALNFTISQNPVKANANVSYNLIGGTTYNVELKVYDVLGNVVANLHDIQDASGQQNADFNANNLSNGTYVLSLNINGTIVTKQIVVSK